MEQLQGKSSLHVEYSEVCTSIRHYSGLRFAVFSVFFAVTGGILTIAYSQTNVALTVRLEILGLLAVTTFWFFEERIIAIANHFLQRASELEKELGFKAWSTRPLYSFIPFMKTAIATRLIYLAVAIFWATSLIV